MPIYEFACRRCRRVFSFLSKRVNPSHVPACPKCGATNLSKEISRFALIKGASEPAPAPEAPGTEGPAMPDFDDPKVSGVMDELERDMDHLDENNPRHMAHLLRKMQQALPAGSIPKEMETALRRLEAGEDPDKIEADMGDVLGDWFGTGESGGEGTPAGGRPFTHDPGLYDY